MGMIPSLAEEECGHLAAREAEPSAVAAGDVSGIGRLLVWTCAALFFGRAWQHLFWDAPYRSLLWSQETMAGAVGFFLGLSWEDYATSPAVAAVIAGSIKIIGGFYLVCGIAALRFTPTRRWTHLMLALGALALTFLAYCSYRDRLHRIGEFVEHASQFALPLLVVLWSRAIFSREVLANVLRVVIALTFAGHGLYAIGVYPTPGEWVTMTMALTGLGDGAAMDFLRIAGGLDFVVAAALFVPHLARPALVYAAAWGLLTALARVAAFVRWDNFAESASQWGFETLVRLPHAALPVALLWLLRAREPAFPLFAPSPTHTPTPVSDPST